MNRSILIAGSVAAVVVIAAVVLWTRGASAPAPSTTAQTSTAAAPATSQPPPSAPPAAAPAPAAPAAAPAPAATAPAAPAPATAAATGTAAPAPQQAAVPPAPAGPPITADDRILGDPSAPITIVEFASLTCPHCADFDANTLPKLKAEWIDSGKARLVFKDFPLDQAAVRGAMLARCAPPEQFYAFIDALFHSQTTWATGGKVDAALGKIAKLAGMGDDQFAACMKDDAAQKRVLDSRLNAEQQYNVESTPTFFVNGVQIVGAQPYAEFQRVLSKAASNP
jgi:protein-disulfide isomerase